MSKAVVLGAAALVFSAASASAQVYTTPDYGYAEPVADLAAPADGYAAPAAPPVYTAPPVYAAPVYAPPTVYVVPAPVYAAPYYAAPVVSRPIYVSGEQFYINYSLNGEHYIMGPYHTRRFAMSHIDDVRRQPGVSNVFLGNKPPDDKSYRKRVPITAMEAR